MRATNCFIYVFAILAALSAAGAARVEPARCSLELVLAVDTSASVDHREYRLQAEGFAKAFRDPTVVAAITAAHGGVVATLVHWSSVNQQRQVIDWTILTDLDSSHAFAAKIEKIARSYSGYGTGLGHALNYSARLIASNRFMCRRQVIDVSGDGRSNVGAAPAPVRDVVVASGITINGIAILIEEPQLETYYRDNVIGGSGAFVMTADAYRNFAEAVRIKLLREIAPRVTWNSGSRSDALRR